MKELIDSLIALNELLEKTEQSSDLREQIGSKNIELINECLNVVAKTILQHGKDKSIRSVYEAEI